MSGRESNFILLRKQIAYGFGADRTDASKFARFYPIHTASILEKANKKIIIYS
jgi:hypothetical protein